MKNLKINKDKLFLYFSLLFSTGLFLFIIINKYINYQISYPLCWDPPAYVGLANLILREGPIFFIKSKHEIGLFYHFVAFLGFILKNTKLAQIILQTLVSIILIHAYSKLTLAVTKSYWMAGITAIICPFTANFIRTYGASSQISALVLIIQILANLNYISDNFKMRDLKSCILVIAGGAISWFHSLYSFIPFLLMLILIFILNPSLNKKRIFKFGALCSILGLIPQIFLMQILVRESIERGLYFPMSPVTLDFYITNLVHFCGDKLFSVMIIGFITLLVMFREGNKKILIGILSWITVLITTYHIAFLLSPWWPQWNVYAERSVWIFPTPLLLTLGLVTLYRGFIGFILPPNINKIVLRIRLFGGDNSILLRKRAVSLLCASILILGISIIILPRSIELENKTWRPYTNKETYNKILIARDELNKMGASGNEPIFIFYSCRLGVANYGKNIIMMEMDSNSYFYYGKLGYLISGEKTPSIYFNQANSDKYEYSAYRSWESMVNNKIVNNISSHPIVIISPEYYPNSHINFDVFTRYYKGNGIYIIPPNIEVKNDIPRDILMGLDDSENVTDGFYGSLKDWSIARSVLTKYASSGTNDSRFEANFPIYLENKTLFVKVRLFDYPPNKYLPIQFYFGEDLLYEFHYSGKDIPIWIEFPIISSREGIEYLKIIIEEGSPKILSLDVIYIWTYEGNNNEKN